MYSCKTLPSHTAEQNRIPFGGHLRCINIRLPAESYREISSIVVRDILSKNANAFRDFGLVRLCKCGMVRTHTAEQNRIPFGGHLRCINIRLPAEAYREINIEYCTIIIEKRQYHDLGLVRLCKCDMVRTPRNRIELL